MAGNADTETAPGKRSFFIGLAVIVVIALLAVSIGFDRMVQFPYGSLEDDAYFYAQIAYNLATLNSSTFDGIHTTDGYHLLWAWLLASVSFVVDLFTSNKSAHMFGYLTVSLICALYIPLRFGRGVLEKLVLLGLAYMGKLLMETHLLTILFLEIATVFALRPREEHGRLIGSLFLIALLPLARIDGTVLLAGVFLWLLWFRDFRSLVWAGAALLLGIMLHFGIMQSIDGGWYSVASALKVQRESSLLSLAALRVNFVGAGMGYTIRAVIEVVLAAVSGFVLLTGLRSERNRRLLAVWIGVMIFAFSHLFLTELRSWYYVPGHVGFAFLFFAAERRPGTMPRLFRTATTAGLLLLIACYVFTREQRKAGYRPEAINVAKFTKAIGQYVPNGEAIYQIDVSGYTGYFAPRPIINGDGLVNTHDYARRFLADRLDGYLEDEGVRYVITNRPIKGNAIVDFHGLVVPADKAELLLEKPDNGGYHWSNFRLFRLIEG